MVVPSIKKEQRLDKTEVSSKKFYLSRTYVLTSIYEIDSCVISRRFFVILS